MTDLMYRIRSKWKAMTNKARALCTIFISIFIALVIVGVWMGICVALNGLAIIAFCTCAIVAVRAGFIIIDESEEEADDD